jgi:hypothetical protein
VPSHPVIRGVASGIPARNLRPPRFLPHSFFFDCPSPVRRGNEAAVPWGGLAPRRQPLACEQGRRIAKHSEDAMERILGQYMGTTGPVPFPHKPRAPVVASFPNARNLRLAGTDSTVDSHFRAYLPTRLCCWPRCFAIHSPTPPRIAADALARSPGTAYPRLPRLASVSGCRRVDVLPRHPRPTALLETIRSRAGATRGTTKTTPRTRTRTTVADRPP